MASKRTVFFKVFRGSMPFHLLISFYKNYIGIIYYQEWSLATLVWFLSYIYTRNFIIITFLLYRWSEPCDPIGHPNPLGIACFDPAQAKEVHGAVIFGKCRRWSRKKRLKRVKKKETSSTLVGWLCHRHSRLPLSAPEIN